MISVGIDVSKGKSTVCILKPYGEIMCSPFEMLHGEKELNALDDLLNKLDGDKDRDGGYRNLSFAYIDILSRKRIFRICY